jgi:hypothetical protein
MNYNDLTSPSAAERFFDQSLLGQLYTLTAEVLGQRTAQDRPAAARRPAPAAASIPKPGVLDRLERWFRAQEQKAREDYLATSADIFELERRIEALDRGTIVRYY